MSMQVVNKTELVLTHPKVYYLFRNGLGETLQATKQALGVYVDQSKIDIERETSVTYVYFLPFVGLLLGMSLFSLYQLAYVQKKVSLVSEGLLSFKLPLYAEMRKLIYERLSTVHGEDTIPNDFTPREQIHPVQLLNACGQGGVIIVAFFGVSLLWYGLEYFWIVARISKDMVLWPDIVEMSVGRITNTLSMWTWMLEAYFYLHPIMTIRNMPGFTLSANPHIDFLKAYSLNKEISMNAMKLEVGGSFTLSDQDLDVMYMETSFNSSYLKKGYHLGINIFQEDARMATTDESGTIRSLIFNLYYCSEAIVNTASQIHDLYDHEMVTRIQSQLDLLTIFVCVHTIVVLLGLSFGIFWVVMRTNTQVRAMWRALHLFPGGSISSSLAPTRGGQRSHTVFSMNLNKI